MAFSGINGNMGINRLGDPSVTFKRKFRYTFSVQPLCGTGDIDPWFVKVASRPNLSIDETELNFLNEKMWIPGKVSYETMTVTYIDVAPTEPASANLYRWLGTVYQFWQPQRRMGSNVSQYGAAAQLMLYDPCGRPIERWDFADMWPQAVNFGDLDNSSSDTVDIELTLRYSRFNYTPLCGTVGFTECCNGCP
jgi:hypothetical protein